MGEGVAVRNTPLLQDSSQMTGYLALVLHAHLPFVRHPEHDEFL